MEKKSASFFTISLTQIFLFREQRQQEDNEFDDIYSFFFLPFQSGPLSV